MATKEPSGMTAQIYQLLLEKIQSCEYMPGAPLHEKRIIEETGIGRTPLREALQALQSAGLVEIFPRRGTRVTPFTEQSVNDLYQMRRLLEPAVLSSYISMYPKSKLLEFSHRFNDVGLDDIAVHYNLDIEFHSFLVSITGNHILMKVHNELMVQLFRLAMYAVKLGTSQLEANNPQHLAIVDALLRENEQEARDALILHINHSLIASLSTIEGRAEHKKKDTPP